MPSAPRVLLAADESPASLAAVRGLHAGGYEVHVAVTRDDTYAARSRRAESVAMLPPEGSDPERYARELAAVARRRGVDVVLPATEGTLRCLTGREHLMGAGVAVGTSPPEALALATSKSDFHRLGAEAGLDIPSSTEVGADDLDAHAAHLTFPAVVKPLRSVEQTLEGRLVTTEVRRVDGIGPLRQVLEGAPGRRWVVQALVPGTLSAIGGVAWRGELVCATHQVSPRIWPPDRGITSFATTVEPDPGRERAVARLLGLIGWSGVFGVQFIARPGQAFAIDLNPRIYGSIGLAIGAGQNLPAIWADLLLGRSPSVGRARVGTRYRVEEDDVRALGHAFRQGRRHEALAGLAPRRGTVHAVFSTSDPWPFSVSLAKARGAATGGRHP